MIGEKSVSGISVGSKYPRSVMRVKRMESRRAGGLCITMPMGLRPASTSSMYFARSPSCMMLQSPMNPPAPHPKGTMSTPIFA